VRSQTILLARRTRTMKLCSYDARNGDHTSRLAACLMHHVPNYAYARVPRMVPGTIFFPWHHFLSSQCRAVQQLPCPGRWLCLSGKECLQYLEYPRFFVCTPLKISAFVP
jgi:hypothetical protein